LKRIKRTAARRIRSKYTNGGATSGLMSQECDGFKLTPMQCRDIGDHSPEEDDTFPESPDEETGTSHANQLTGSVLRTYWIYRYSVSANTNDYFLLCFFCLFDISNFSSIWRTSSSVCDLSSSSDPAEPHSSEYQPSGGFQLTFACI
jgi:hypothetical protein